MNYSSREAICSEAVLGNDQCDSAFFVLFAQCAMVFPVLDLVE